MANREEADLPLEKADIHKVYWLNRDLLAEDPLLLILSPKKVTIIKGRPCKMAMFAIDEEGIFGSRARAVLSKKTISTTTSLGSRAGDKTRVTTALV
jgi:hypothetical protein